MYGNEFLNVYGFRENNFNQKTPSGTIAITAKPDGTKPNILTMPDGAMFMVFLGFSTIMIIVLLRFPGFRKMARDRTGTVKHLDRFPCRNCRYFTDNPYLKCAVHPDTALTKLVIDCPDYCDRRVKK